MRRPKAAAGSFQDAPHLPPLWRLSRSVGPVDGRNARQRHNELSALGEIAASSRPQGRGMAEDKLFNSYQRQDVLPTFGNFNSAAELPGTMRAGYDNFLNVFSHIINLARYVLGSPPAVAESNIESSGAATVTLDSTASPARYSSRMDPKASGARG
jgi:hypothetical protein